MADSEVKRADRRLIIAIVFCCIGGTILAVVAIWFLLQPWTTGKGRLIGGAFVGLFLVAVGTGELRHRLRHGPQRPGRRVGRPSA